MLWDQEAKGECWSPDVFNHSSYVVSSFTVLTDLVLAIVPIHAFWKLQLKRQDKLEITFMLGLTFLSAVFTIIKATYLSTFNDRTDPCKLIDATPPVRHIPIVITLSNSSCSIQRRDVDHLGLVSLCIP
jgi:hypothetical protein